MNGDVHAGESVLSANVRGLLLQGGGGGGDKPAKCERTQPQQRWPVIV